MRQLSGHSYKFGIWITAVFFCAVFGWLNLHPGNAIASITNSGTELLAPACLMAGPASPPVAKREQGLAQAGIRGVIAYAEEDGNLYLYIGEINETIQLTSDASNSGYTFPRFSPDGRFLAYLTDNASGGDLYVMDLETKVSERLARKVGYWGNYDWAPDSKSIIYGFDAEKSCLAYDQESTFGIFQIQLDTQDKTEIIAPHGTIVPLKGPKFSGDGNWISFESYPCFSSGYRFYTMNIATGETYDSGAGAEADWSPSEPMLAIAQSTWGGGEGNLAMNTPDLNQMDLIDASSGMQFGDPNFSPDGYWVALRSYTLTESLYVSDEEMARWEDNTILLNLQDERQLEICSSREMVGCGFVSWSPDGSQVIFYTNENNNAQWYIYNLENNERVSIPPFGIVRYESQGGYLDWISYELLPESYRAGHDPTPTTYPTNIDPTSDQNIETDSPLTNATPQPTSQGTLTKPQSGVSWIFYAGFGLVLVVILILIIWIANQKNHV